MLFLKLYIYCNYSHYYFNQQSACKYLLCMKLRSTNCCSCSYYALMLLYICTVICSLSWPGPSLHRGTIVCSIYVPILQAIMPLREPGSGHKRLDH